MNNHVIFVHRTLRRQRRPYRLLPPNANECREQPANCLRVIPGQSRIDPERPWRGLPRHGSPIGHDKSAGRIDHVGCISHLLAAGFEGPMLCSEPSAKLLPIVLEDAFKLSFSRNKAQIAKYIRLVEQRPIPLPYHQWFSLINTDELVARIRLHRAGRILGSAYVEVDLAYMQTGQNQRVVVSGDLGAPHAPFLMPPESPERVDILVLESTYGIDSTRTARTAGSGSKPLSSERYRTKAPSSSPLLASAALKSCFTNSKRSSKRFAPAPNNPLSPSGGRRG